MTIVVNYTPFRDSSSGTNFKKTQLGMVRTTSPIPCVIHILFLNHTVHIVVDYILPQHNHNPPNVTGTQFNHLGGMKWPKEHTSYNFVLRKFSQLQTLHHQRDANPELHDYHADTQSHIFSVIPCVIPPFIIIHILLVKFLY